MVSTPLTPGDIMERFQLLLLAPNSLHCIHLLQIEPTIHYHHHHHHHLPTSCRHAHSSRYIVLQPPHCRLGLYWPITIPLILWCHPSHFQSIQNQPHALGTHRQLLLLKTASAPLCIPLPSMLSTLSSAGSVLGWAMLSLQQPHRRILCPILLHTHYNLLSL